MQYIYIYMYNIYIYLYITNSMTITIWRLVLQIFFGTSSTSAAGARLAFGGGAARGQGILIVDAEDYQPSMMFFIREISNRQ